jgi:hypothetical protein
VGREERYRTVISGMEPRRIAVVMLLPRTEGHCRNHVIAWAAFVSILPGRILPQPSGRSGTLRTDQRSMGNSRRPSSGQSSGQNAPDQRPIQAQSQSSGQACPERGRRECPPYISKVYRARASTSVTSSGCSLSPIQFSTAVVTNWLIWGNGRFRLSLTRSISRCSPNSPKSFSGSVTPSL